MCWTIISDEERSKYIFIQSTNFEIKPEMSPTNAGFLRKVHFSGIKKNFGVFNLFVGMVDPFLMLLLILNIF
jgi:hypothetical protein